MQVKAGRQKIKPGLSLDKMEGRREQRFEKEREKHKGKEEADVKDPRHASLPRSRLL